MSFLRKPLHFMTKSHGQTAFCVGDRCFNSHIATRNTHYHSLGARGSAWPHQRCAAVAWAKSAPAFLRTPAAPVQPSGAPCSTAVHPEAHWVRRRSSSAPCTSRLALSRSGEPFPQTRSNNRSRCGNMINNPAGVTRECFPKCERSRPQQLRKSRPDRSLAPWPKH